MSAKCTVCGVNFVGVPELPIEATICVRCDNKRLRQENAQLAVTIRLTLEEQSHLADGDNCTLIRLKQADTGTALRDLLAPTIELLNRLDDDTDSVVLQESIKAELTRLRDLCAEKGPAK